MTKNSQLIANTKVAHAAITDILEKVAPLSKILQTIDILKMTGAYP